MSGVDETYCVQNGVYYRKQYQMHKSMENLLRTFIEY